MTQTRSMPRVRSEDEHIQVDKSTEKTQLRSPFKRPRPLADENEDNSGYTKKPRIHIQPTDDEDSDADADDSDLEEVTRILIDQELYYPEQDPDPEAGRGLGAILYPNLEAQSNQDMCNHTPDPHTDVDMQSQE